jgi:hypothetical protein
MLPYEVAFVEKGIGGHDTGAVKQLSTNITGVASAKLFQHVARDSILLSLFSLLYKVRNLSGLAAPAGILHIAPDDKRTELGMSAQASRLEDDN